MSGGAARRAAWAGASLIALLVLTSSRVEPVGPPTIPRPPRFVEEAGAAGIAHRYAGEFGYFVGGGVAAFDCDEDGRADLYFAGGEEAAGLYRNESPPGGALSFSRVRDAATDLMQVTGAYPLDIDSDRVVDLMVLRTEENVVLRGLGECRFERANEAWGIDGGHAWSTAFSAAWEHGAEWPTLAVGNYLDESSADRARLCHDNELVRPQAMGAGFAPAVALSPGWCALSMLFSDWDRSGRRDLRVSNDRHYYSDYGDGEEQLWRIAPGEDPRLYTREEGWQPVRIWGMGIASHDLTDDGYPEYFLTSQGDNKLQALTDGPDGPRFGDIALERAVTAHRPYAGDVTLPSTAWHAEFQDVNNDGLIDLFVAKGNVEAMPEYAAEDPNNLLLGGGDGTFAESADAAGIVTFARARGAALADLNLDGMLDLVVVNRRENVELWRNVGSGSAAEPMPMGNWIAVRLDQAGANPDAIGAWIEVRAGDEISRREITVGGGHAGGQLGWVHFGLGGATRAEVAVRWPDGRAGSWLPVEANSFVTVEPEATEAQRWSPPQR